MLQNLRHSCLTQPYWLPVEKSARTPWRRYLTVFGPVTAISISEKRNTWPWRMPLHVQEVSTTQKQETLRVTLKHPSLCPLWNSIITCSYPQGKIVLYSVSSQQKLSGRAYCSVSSQQKLSGRLYCSVSSQQELSGRKGHPEHGIPKCGEKHKFVNLLVSIATE